MKRRAFSLLEMMVVCFLTGLVMTLMLQLFLPSLWLFKTEQAATEAHQTTLMLMGRLNRELWNTSPDTITITNTVTDLRCSFVEVAGVTSSGALQWNPDGFTVYCYNRASQRVFRLYTMDNFVASLAVAPRLTPDQLQALKFQSVIAKHVEELSIAGQDAELNVLKYPLTVRVGTAVPEERATNQLTLQRFALQSRVFPKSMRI